MGRRYFGEHQGPRHEKTALLVGLLVPPSAQVFFSSQLINVVKGIIMVPRLMSDRQ